MQRKPDCEQYLARRLSESWLARAVEREALAKQLILSRKQFDALEAADPSPFHTYGIYLRAMRSALKEAQLLEDPEVLNCLETLVSDYMRSPSISHVVQVKQTVNKKLGVAPPDRKPAESPSPRAGLALVLAVFAILFLATLLALN